MSVLFVVLPAALLLVGVAIGAYVWAARRGQFEDLTTPAIRVALDDDDAPPRDRDSGAA
jgi:cbb3-type cytochrome oxidase maturation protein